LNYTRALHVFETYFFEARVIIAQHWAKINVSGFSFSCIGMLY